mmetsp:Transcript_53304/g.170788  ORF Transcript_53304/g.170788 Transcript_53304/m.170788 type:complete len:256 (+) Transcript_53304:411-1178(+)
MPQRAPSPLPPPPVLPTSCCGREPEAPAAGPPSSGGCSGPLRCCSTLSCCNRSRICPSYSFVTLEMALEELALCSRRTCCSSETCRLLSCSWASAAANLFRFCFSRWRSLMIFLQYLHRSSFASSAGTPASSASKEPVPPDAGLTSCRAFAMRASRKSISSCRPSRRSSMSWRMPRPSARLPCTSRCSSPRSAVSASRWALARNAAPGSAAPASRLPRCASASSSSTRESCASSCCSCPRASCCSRPSFSEILRL